MNVDVPCSSKLLGDTCPKQPGTKSSIETCREQQGPSKSSVTKTLTFDLNETSGNYDQSITNLFQAPITSIGREQIIEKNLGDIFSCTICKGVPSMPVITPCSHMYCSPCIKAWLSSASSCPDCRSVTSIDDLSRLKGPLLQLYETIHACCKFSSDGCLEVLELKSLYNHEDQCKYGKFPSHFCSPKSKKQTIRNKEPICNCKKKYLRHKRLKPVIDFITEFCESKGENKSDVLFFTLYDCLKGSDDSRANDVMNIWSDKHSKLNAHQCLAIRVDILQSKSQYQGQYQILKSNSNCPLQPLSALNSVEYLYMPQSVRYTIHSEGQEIEKIVHHTPAKLAKSQEQVSASSNPLPTFEPLDVLEGFSEFVPEIPIPNLKGVKWSYLDAIAKTLQELDEQLVQGLENLNIDPNDPNLTFLTSIKDGADGMGIFQFIKKSVIVFYPIKHLDFLSV